MLFDPNTRMVMRFIGGNYHNPDAPSVVSYSGMYGLEVPCIYGFYSLMDDYANHGSAEWRNVDGKDHVLDGYIGECMAFWANHMIQLLKEHNK
jgi:hypothetical protein